MLDGLIHEYLAALVTPARPTITTLLVESQNMFIKEATASALQRTAEIMPSIYFQEPCFSNIFHGLTISIESHPRVEQLRVYEYIT